MMVLIKKCRACILIIIFWMNAFYPNSVVSAVNRQESSSQKNKELVKILKSNTIVGYTVSYLLELQCKYPQISPELLKDRIKFISVMEDMYNKDPNDDKVALIYVCILTDTDNVSKAREIINKIKEPHKLGNLFYCYDTKIAAKTGDLERALTSFKQIKYPHNDPDVWHLEGLLNANKGDEKKALSIWESLIKKYPEHGLTYYDLGVAYTIFNEYDKAIVSFEKAWGYLNENYKKEKQKTRLQQAYIEIIIFKNKENGVKHLQEAIELDPSSPELKDFCDKVGFKMPNIVENNTKLDEAYTLIEKRDYTKAENIISSVLENDKNNPKAMWYLAYLKYSQEKHAEAIELFQKLLDLNLLDPKTPNYPNAHLFIGNSYRFRLPTVGLTDEEMQKMFYHYEEFMKYTDSSEGKRDVTNFLLDIKKKYVPGVVKRWTITANEEQDK